MNRVIARIGALIVSVTVFLFAVCMLISFSFGSYFVCMFLPIGYIMMTAGFCAECDEKHRVAANAGMMFAAVYAVLILIVYFAQTTVVRLDSFDEQLTRILDFSRGGLLFNYDLLGYGFMDKVPAQAEAVTRVAEILKEESAAPVYAFAFPRDTQGANGHPSWKAQVQGGNLLADFLENIL